MERVALMAERRDDNGDEHEGVPGGDAFFSQLENIPAATLAAHLDQLSSSWRNEPIFIAARKELQQWIECRRALSELFDGADPDEWVERASVTFSECKPWCARMILSAAEAAEADGLLAAEAVLLQVWERLAEAEGQAAATLSRLDDMHPGEEIAVSAWYCRYGDFVLAEWGDSGREYVEMAEDIYRQVALRHPEALTPMGRAFLEDPPDKGGIGAWVERIQRTSE